MFMARPDAAPTKVRPPTVPHRETVILPRAGKTAGKGQDCTHI